MSRKAYFIIILVLCLGVPFCNRPKEKTPGPSDQPPEDSKVATDINFIGQGTQSPDLSGNEKPYHSPTLSTPPPPTSLKWTASIQSAINIANKDNQYKIFVWFSSKNCEECITIERDVFTNKEVLKNSGKWLFVKLDAERDKNETEYYLKGGAPPAILCLDMMGHAYRKQFGPVTVEEMVTILQTWR